MMTAGGGVAQPSFVANAVRYGTAKAEWFLNLVSESASLVVPN